MNKICEFQRSYIKPSSNASNYRLNSIQRNSTLLVSASQVFLISNEMANKDVNVNIQIEEGDVLGATPSENLVITRIQHGTLAEGHLQEGDKILKVNGTEPRDQTHFYRLVVAASRTGNLNMVVRRETKTIELVKEAKHQVPQERMSNLRLRDGFHYKLITMEYQRGDKIGLGIKDYMNCVVVTKAPDGTMAGRVFKVGDQICDVDNIRVTDKGVCQTLIVSALKVSSFFFLHV